MSEPATHSDAAAEGHPKGLYVLFFSEAWERFSYYGMRALLVLYMTRHLQFSREDALSIYGTYTGLVYLTPYFGGLLADRYLGRRKAVIIGSFLMMAGHLAMASEPLLNYALGLLIVGNGFFKPNISTIVGGLYREGDARRDGGFTIFYMGINLGAFFAPIVCGALGESRSFGWHYGFSAAAIGMAAGLGVFLWGQKFFGNVGLPPGRVAKDAHIGADEHNPGLVSKDWIDIAIYTGAGVALVLGVIHGYPLVSGLPAQIGIPASVTWVLMAVLGLSMIVLPIWRSKPDATELQRIIVIFILCFFNIFFWMGFEQAGGTMTLFADSQTNRMVGGPTYLVIGVFLAVCGFAIWEATRKEPSGKPLWWGLVGLMGAACGYYLFQGTKLLMSGDQVELTASEFQAINPLLIVAFGATVGRLWTRMDSKDSTRTSSATKMAIGMFILGLGFVVMYFGQQSAVAGNTQGPDGQTVLGRVGPEWLFFVYALHTMGELSLSPIGLSMVTKLAPVRLVSVLMGVWLMSSAAANKAAASLEHVVSEYHLSVYAVLIGTSMGAAALLLALSGILKRMMHGAEDVMEAPVGHIVPAHSGSATVPVEQPGDGSTDIVLGVVLLAIGGGVTLLSVTSGSGTIVVTTGLIIAGVARIVIGLRKQAGRK